MSKFTEEEVKMLTKLVEKNNYSYQFRFSLCENGGLITIGCVTYAFQGTKAEFLRVAGMRISDTEEFIREYGDYFNMGRLLKSNITGGGDGQIEALN